MLPLYGRAEVTRACYEYRQSIETTLHIFPLQMLFDEVQACTAKHAGARRSVRA